MKNQIIQKFKQNFSIFKLYIENYYIRAVYKNIIITFYITRRRGYTRCEILDVEIKQKIFDGKIRNFNDFEKIYKLRKIKEHINETSKNN